MRELPIGDGLSMKGKIKRRGDVLPHSGGEE